MTQRATIWAATIILSGMLSFSVLPARQAKALPTPEKVIYIEAEIEVYLLPACREVRAKGKKAGWLPMQGNGLNLNQDDYFFFWVFGVDDEPSVQAGSVLIGHFAVNKWTGDVWNLRALIHDEQRVTDGELAGLQKILIAGHHIDETTIREYGSRPLWVPEEKPH